MIYVCPKCGYKSLSKFILCPECKKGIMEEQIEETKEKFVSSKKEKEIIKNKKNIKKRKLTRIKDVEINKEERYKLNSFKELNKVFGNGIMKNSLNLLYGQPGIGKSTLLLQLIDDLSKNTNIKCAYISGEETKEQIKRRYNRLKLNSEFIVDNETNLLQIIEDYEDFDFLIIDSIQTLYLPEAGEKGGVAQIKACTNFLMDFAKNKNKTIILIGQITKDMNMAGPKVLEHMVDAVFEMKFYDKQEVYRYIKSNKNRFGEVGEITIFKMEENGLKEISNPSLLFINNNSKSVGKSFSLILDGKKPIFLEIQSLVIDSYNDKNYIQSLGINQKRLNQINAILIKNLLLKTFSTHIYTQISGGLKVKETDTHIDLAIAASLISSSEEIVLPNNLLFLGEISLTGEIVNVNNEEKYIEIAK